MQVESRKMTLMLGQYDLGTVEVVIEKDCVRIPNKFPHSHLPGDVVMHYEIRREPDKISAFQAIQKLEDLDRTLTEYEALIQIMEAHPKKFSRQTIETVKKLIEEVRRKKDDLEQRLKDVKV